MRLKNPRPRVDSHRRVRITDPAPPVGSGPLPRAGNAGESGDRDGVPRTEIVDTTTRSPEWSRAVRSPCREIVDLLTRK
jgi:hypothetical protein